MSGFICSGYFLRKQERSLGISEAEKIKIAVIATQKSGALAAVNETTLEILSNTPFGL